MQYNLKKLGMLTLVVATFASIFTAAAARADYKTPEAMAANKLLCDNNKDAMACLLYGDGLYIVALKAGLEKTLPDTQVKADIKSAMTWKAKACDMGSWRACEVLGYAYTNGHGGLPVDKGLGYAYFKKACNGDTNFCTGLNSVPASNASVAAIPNAQDTCMKIFVDAKNVINTHSDYEKRLEARAEKIKQRQREGDMSSNADVLEYNKSLHNFNDGKCTQMVRFARKSRDAACAVEQTNALLGYARDYKAGVKAGMVGSCIYDLNTFNGR